jgi:hypothetical protein
VFANVCGILRDNSGGSGPVRDPADIDKGGGEVAPEHPTGLHSDQTGMEEIAKPPGAGEVMKAPVGKGCESSPWAKAGKHVVENGQLQVVGKRCPRKARDHNIEGGVVRPEGREVELLCGGVFEAVTGVILAEGVDKVAIQLQAKVGGSMRQCIQDRGGKGTGAGSEFDDTICAPDFSHFGHASTQSGRRRCDGTHIFPVFECLSGKGK